MDKFESSDRIFSSFSSTRLENEARFRFLPLVFLTMALRVMVPSKKLLKQIQFHPCHFVHHSIYIYFHKVNIVRGLLPQKRRIFSFSSRPLLSILRSNVTHFVPYSFFTVGITTVLTSILHNTGPRHRYPSTALRHCELFFPHTKNL